MNDAIPRCGTTVAVHARHPVREASEKLDMPRLRAERFGGDARRQRDVIGRIACGDAEGTRNHVGLQPAIGISEQHPLAGSRVGSHMACVRFPEPAIRQVLDAYRTYTRTSTRVVEI